MSFRKTSLIFTLLTGLLFSPSFSKIQASSVLSLEGNWIAGYKTSGGWSAFNVQFKSQDGAVQGTAVLPPGNILYEDAKTVDLLNLVLEDNKIHFEIPSPEGNLIFEGTFKDGEIVGLYKRGEISGDAQLIRLAEVKPEVWKKYLGEYGYGLRHYVSVFQFSQQAEDGELFYYDSESGRIGKLNPLSETSFFSGPNMAGSFPIEIRATFKADGTGGVRALSWKKSGYPDVEAKNNQFARQEEVTYPSGDVTLAGSLRIPNTPGPHPAIVYAHGSGPGTRNQISMVAHFFLHQGFAVLGYDKRGVGQSTGDWRRIDFDGLAADALAGVKYLQSRQDINPKQVGLYGISQGGWVVSLAASLSPDVAFFISHSGPGVSPKRQEFYMLTNILKESGFTAAEIDGLLEALQFLYEYARTGQNGDRLDRAVEALKKNPKFAEDEGSLPPLSKDVKFENFYAKQRLGDPGWFYHLNVDYDPIPAYKKVRCPGLVIFGKHDFTVPVEESVERIGKALEETGSKNCLIKVFSNGSHGVLEVDSNKPSTYASPPRFIEGYLQFLSDWLRQVLKDS